ncbi:hypothetical protein Ahy_B10g101685 [Arachis hypogaea]|uniref:Zinc finger PMZ-type domain-containing protein n=1 Tax=Arachis hypogaea TaxID=3818 RepID=A0A444X068_ARAHY|nr:hypothetical protein Ahy_B10g101685 [Arachis hypogaea]
MDNMDKIKRVSEEAWTYLNKWPRHSWTKSQFSHRPKLDNICNNACEIFNARIKEARSKPIITLLEEVRMFVMRSITKNKVKLNNHVGKLPPVIQSRLDKVRKESMNWVPICTIDEDYENLRSMDTQQTWQETLHLSVLDVNSFTSFIMLVGMDLNWIGLFTIGIPCVHACAALAWVNKRPEDFCHPLVTMELYKKTYEHHINPLPGQSLWEKSVYNQPQAPNIKRKPGKLTTKRRKDANEGTSGNKKAKPTIAKAVHLATPRGDIKKRADDVAAALAAAATVVAAAKSKTTPTRSTPAAAEASNTANELPQVVEAPSGAVDAAEIDLSQQNHGGTQDEALPAPTTKKPHKLPTKRRNSPPPITAYVDPMQGASVATSSRLVNFMKFVPTPGFKAPRKKSTK